MSDIPPMTDAFIDLRKGLHHCRTVQGDAFCEECQEYWPCSMIRALARIAADREEIAQLRQAAIDGRNKSQDAHERTLARMEHIAAENERIKEKCATFLRIMERAEILLNRFISTQPSCRNMDCQECIPCLTRDVTRHIDAAFATEPK